MSDQLDLFGTAIALPPVSHRDDPETSRIAERMMASRRPTLMRRLLAEYVASDGLTDEEAGVRSGIQPRNEAAKRCSDLRQTGLVEPTGRTAIWRSGRPQQVCAVTDLGRKVARKMAGS